MQILDSARLVELAEQLDRRAGVLESIRQQLRARAEQLQWHGPAGQACAASVSRALKLLTSCQHRCAVTAASLRQHRTTAAHRLATLSKVEHTAAKFARGVARVL
jgi:hypothetical protein